MWRGAGGALKTMRACERSPSDARCEAAGRAVGSWNSGPIDGDIA